jgi:AbrB-like transcriptional regulator
MVFLSIEGGILSIVKHEYFLKSIMTIATTSPLTGKALLRQVTELASSSKRDTAIACGYAKTAKSGKIRVDLTGFYNAVLAAKGVNVDADEKQDGRGKVASYRVTVQKNGSLIIGSTYTKKLGLVEGDVLEIKLGSKHIRLIPVTVEVPTTVEAPTASTAKTTAIPTKSPVPTAKSTAKAGKVPVGKSPVEAAPVAATAKSPAAVPPATGGKKQQANKKAGKRR